MDPEQIIGQLIGGFFGGKSKRSRGGFGLSTLGLGGRGRATHGGGLVNAGTLLTVGGLIWGALETMQQTGAAAGSSGPAIPAPTTPAGAGTGARRDSGSHAGRWRFHRRCRPFLEPRRRCPMPRWWCRCRRHWCRSCSWR